MKILKILTLMISFGLVSCGTGPSNERDSARTHLKFDDATSLSRVDFKHSAGKTEEKLLPEIMGGGVGIGDFNRDGAPDLVFVNSGSVNSDQRPSDAGNQLYLNDGNGQFTEKTKEWNLSSTGYGQGIAVGDYDNDGLDDLYLTNREGNNRLLRNTGNRFEDVTEKAGLASDLGWSTSAGFSDFDNDGDLDLFVTRYVKFDPQNPHRVYNHGMLIYSTPIYYEALPDKLFVNTGDGKFIDGSDSAGINKPGNGLAIGLGDIDSDGDTDVYVANDSDENHLWINDGNGSFTESANISGTAYDQFGNSEGSMGTDFSDVDGNGQFDIVVTSFQYERTSLYLQTGPVLFQESSSTHGIAKTSLLRLSFGIEFFDADNDGDEDLIVANGHIIDNIEKQSASVTFAQSNSLYENAGNGKFSDISEIAGDALGDVQVSRGLAVADLDSDGDLDFVVVNNDGRAQVAFNETENKGNFVGLLLEGKNANRSAIGARIVAHIGKRKIERQIMGSQSYLSVSDFRVLLGTGKDETIDSLEIHWPGGRKQTVISIATGKFYYILEDADPIEFVPGKLKK